MLKTLIVFMTLIGSSFAETEIRTNLNGSLTTLAKDDSVFQSHSTLSFGSKDFQIGAYIGYEKMHSYIKDTSFGAMLRFGSSTYFELQTGSFKRELKDFSQNLSGTGYIVNLILGKNLSEHIALSIFTTAKRIENGDLEKRWIVDVLPFFGFKGGF